MSSSTFHLISYTIFNSQNEGREYAVPANKNYASEVSTLQIFAGITDSDSV